jgi:hypothetical protein
MSKIMVETTSVVLFLLCASASAFGPAAPNITCSSCTESAACKDATHVVIPDTVSDIKPSAFAGCTKLEAVFISANVKSVGASAFQGCQSLTSVYIPPSVEEVSYQAFPSCFGYGLITAENDLPRGAIKCLACVGLTNLDLPHGLTGIGDYAFGGQDACTQLQSVSMPSTIVSIGTAAFQGCTSLTSVKIPTDVDVIKGMAFYGCTSMARLTFEGDRLGQIDDSAFQGCTSLNAVTLPMYITNIGAYGFAGCTSLTTMSIPENNGRLTIGDHAFDGKEPVFLRAEPVGFRLSFCEQSRWGSISPSS